jgi:hypothetical protein
LLGSLFKPSNFEKSPFPGANSDMVSEKKTLASVPTTVGAMGAATAALCSIAAQSNDEKVTAAGIPPAPQAPNGDCSAGWEKIRQIIAANPAMLNEPANPVVASLMGVAGKKAAAKGPVCANPNCGDFGHTLSFCPVPVDLGHGDMTGCFFCNLVDHEADQW